MELALAGVDAVAAKPAEAPWPICAGLPVAATTTRHDPAQLDLAVGEGCSDNVRVVHPTCHFSPPAPARPVALQSATGATGTRTKALRHAIRLVRAKTGIRSGQPPGRRRGWLA